MNKRIAALLMLVVLLMTMPVAWAGRKKAEPVVERIIYIPQDNRPISDKQTAELVQKLGYEVVVPPNELLGDRQNLGEPDKLWDWLNQNATDAKAAVISSDALLYGSLVGSRKHEYQAAQLSERVERFKTFHKENAKLPLYVFSSIMRTPKSAEASGHEEPVYYRTYGSDIFRYTVLEDKAESEGLSRREQKEMAFLQELIPKNSLKDWLDRRQKNFTVNKQLLGLSQNNVFSYLIIGRDDNAPYSRTHLESRHLMAASAKATQDNLQIMAGIDEIGALLLTRAVNAEQNYQPKVFVRYNWGRGEYTVPAYSDEKIGASIKSAILAGGGEVVKKPNEADFVLAVNTNPNGKTFEASDRANDGTQREGTKYFADIVTDYIKKGYPVGIADISYANGSDNSLMELLKERQLLFKLRAYAGWNTPTNSTGFAVAMGMLVPHMKQADVEQLLVTRYLDDWCYQANVRNIIARQLSWLRGDGVYGSLDEKTEAVAQRSQVMITKFVAENLPKLPSLEELTISFPWNRLFEADIKNQEHQEISFLKDKIKY